MPRHEEAPTQPHRFAFVHSHLGKRLLTLTCMFCAVQFVSPKRDVLRIIEGIHRCPRMIKALREK